MWRSSTANDSSYALAILMLVAAALWLPLLWLSDLILRGGFSSEMADDGGSATKMRIYIVRLFIVRGCDSRRSPAGDHRAQGSRQPQLQRVSAAILDGGAFEMADDESDSWMLNGCRCSTVVWVLVCDCRCVIVRLWRLFRGLALRAKSGWPAKALATARRGR